MQVVTATRDLTVPTERGRSVLRLPAGQTAVVYDAEAAAAALQPGARLEPAERGPRPFRADDVAVERLLIPFSGSLSSALSLLPVLAALRSAHPGVRIEVAAPPIASELLVLSPLVDRLHAYPVPVSIWRDADVYLPVEHALRSSAACGLARSSALAGSLGIALERVAFALRLPPVPRRLDGPVVAVAIEHGQESATTPELMGGVVEGLLETGAGVVLLGHHDEEWSFPATPEILDLRSRTPSVAQLATALQLADAAVGEPSFILHLAGALERPAVALLETGEMGCALDYQTVYPVPAPAPSALGAEDPLAARRARMAIDAVVRAVVDRLEPLLAAA